MKEGLFDRVGMRIRGRKDDIVVTEAGIIAAVHREGAKATADYFQQIDRAGGDSNGAVLLNEELRVETRLRTFQNRRYKRMPRR